MPSHGLAFPQDRHDWIPFHRTMEDLYGALAQYYDVQYLSLRTAVYRLANFKKVPGKGWKNFMDVDGFHPGDGGFRVMADLSVWLIQQTALDLLMRPLNKDDTEMIHEDLPPPMYPGQLAIAGGWCRRAGSVS